MKTLYKSTPVERFCAKRYYHENKEDISEKRKERIESTVRGRCSRLRANSSARAKREGWDYNLTLDFLEELWYEQDGLCALTGRKLLLRGDGKRWSTDLVSLDRIDSNKGYVKDNVWLVAQPVNYAKGVQSLDEFIEMCREVVENHG